LASAEISVACGAGSGCAIALCRFGAPAHAEDERDLLSPGRRVDELSGF
jgi:hypothetical protein